MRLVTFAAGPAWTPRLGVRVGHRILDVENASRVDGEPLPCTLKALLREGRGAVSRVQALAKAAQSTAGRFSGAMLEEKAIRFLPPIPDPDQFLCVGQNYRSRSEDAERKDLVRQMPDEIVGFTRLIPTLVGHNAKVAKPAAVLRLAYWPELVFVVGRRARGVTGAEDAMDYVAGVTLMNSLADRDLQDRDKASGLRSPTSINSPGFGPLGPEMVTLDEIGDPDELWMTCSVNGEERMRVNTQDQVWKVGEILEHFSREVTLEPGDMFSTGGSDGAAGRPDAGDLFLKPGDVVECSIEGITTLRTTIIAP